MAIASALAEFKKAPAGDANSELALSKMVEFLERQEKARVTKQEEEDLNTVEARKLGRHVNAAGVYENNFPPEISFLNPLGERDNPRADLKCDMYWVGHELRKEGVSREEIELLNQMTPGTYMVTGSDMQLVKLTVKGREANDGSLERMSFHFAFKNADDRQRVRPMTEWLREALGDKIPTAAALLAEIETLKQQLANK